MFCFRGKILKIVSICAGKSALFISTQIFLPVGLLDFRRATSFAFLSNEETFVC